MNLNCSCCGMRFRGKQDSNHDKGFSNCPDCAQEIEIKNESQWDRIRDKVANALSPKHRQKFLVMEVALQRGIMLKMMDEGVIKWTIGGR